MKLLNSDGIKRGCAKSEAELNAVVRGLIEVRLCYVFVSRNERERFDIFKCRSTSLKIRIDWV